MARPLVNKTRLNLSAAAASVTVATFLVALKLWALGATSSLAVAASLADSAMDMMVSLSGLIAILYAARPPDVQRLGGSLVAAAHGGNRAAAHVVEG